MRRGCVATIVASSAVVGLACGTTATAQDPPPSNPATRQSRLEQLRQEAGVDDWRRVSWALHDAVGEGVREIGGDLPPLFRRLAHAWGSKPSRDERTGIDFATAWALDAAIQFSTKVSDDELLGIAKGSSLSEDALLIVAARQPEKCLETLLLLARDLPEDVVEDAACEVLASAAPSRLLDHLLAHLTIELRVVVCDGKPSPIDPTPSRTGVG